MPQFRAEITHSYARRFEAETLEAAIVYANDRFSRAVMPEAYGPTAFSDETISVVIGGVFLLAAHAHQQLKLAA